MSRCRFTVRALGEGDHDRIAAFIAQRWGELGVVSRGRLHDPSALPGFAAVVEDDLVGVATYRIEGSECELVTIDAVSEGIGIGTGLLEAVVRAARTHGCTRLWLITTNDNLRALRFYQRRGFRLAALHRGALETSRRLKPSIPETGLHGIPLRDELELERPL